MDIKEIFTHQKIAYHTEYIDGIACTIGYIKKFRMAWAITHLNTFIIVGETLELIDKKRIEKFSNEAINYTIKNSKGWPKGLQSFIASIAILKDENVDITAIGFCENPKKKHFAAFEIPVVYELENNKGARYVSNPFWGRLYFPYFRKIIYDLLENFN